VYFKQTNAVDLHVYGTLSAGSAIFTCFYR